MTTQCPHCGTRYAWLERLAGPTSCKECHERHHLPSVEEAFKDERAISGTGTAEQLRVIDPNRALGRIAGRNFAVGLTLFVLGLALPVATLAISAQRGGGSFIFSGTLCFVGVERFVRGWSQLSALKRKRKYGDSNRASRNQA